MSRAWPFANKLRLGFLILALLALLISLASIIVLKSIALQSDRITSDYKNDLVLIEKLGTLFERSSSANRAYLLTRQREHWLRFQESRREYDEILMALNREFAPETAELDRIGEALDRSSSAMSSGDSAAGLRSRFDATVNRMKLRESRLLQEATARSRSSAQRALQALIVIGVVGLSIIFGLILLVNRLLDDFKRVEQDLRESEAKFRLLVNGAKDHAIFMLDASGRIISWNSGAERLTGYRADEVLGTGIRRFFLPEDIQAGGLEEVISLALLEGSHESEGWRLRKDGSRFWANSLVTALRDDQGEITGFSIVTRDITEHQRQKLAQELLAEAGDVFSRSLDYRATLAAVAKLVVPRLADHCVIYIRERSEGPMSYLELASSDPEKSQTVREMLNRYPPIAGRGAIYRVLRYSQSVLDPVIDDEWYRANAMDEGHEALLRKLGFKSMMVVPVLAAGKVRGVLGFASESQHYTLQDLTLASELGRRAGAAVENASLYQDARNAINVRDEFLSIASHELKTPLTSLYLQLQLLQRSAQAQLGEGTTAEQAKFLLSPANAAMMLDSCRMQSKRLGRLIDELLDLTRIRSGKLELRMGPVDLVAVVRDVVNRLGADIMHAGCIITMELPDSVTGNWDRSRIEQVVTNLISNAVKYGEGKPIYVKVAHDPETSLARLSVRDEGIGISPENQQRIFERFERAITSKYISGLGLGLYIVRQIVEALNGKISVESALSQGATFTVELPTQAAHQVRLPLQLIEMPASASPDNFLSN